MLAKCLIFKHLIVSLHITSNFFKFYNVKLKILEDSDFLTLHKGLPFFFFFPPM